MDPRPQLAFLSDPLAPECDVEPESKPNSIHVSGSKRFSGAWCTHGHKKEEKEVARQPKRPTDGAYMVHPSPASPSVDRFCALVAAIWADKAKQSSFEPVEGLRGSIESEEDSVQSSTVKRAPAVRTKRPAGSLRQSICGMSCFNCRAGTICTLLRKSARTSAPWPKDDEIDDKSIINGPKWIEICRSSPALAFQLPLSIQGYRR